MERDVVVFAVPNVTLVAQEIVYFIAGAKEFAELFNRHLDVSTLRVDRIEIHDHEDDAVPRRRQLAVEKESFVIDRMKTQVVVELEGAILAPDPV
jgi:hypothetical protein